MVAHNYINNHFYYTKYINRDLNKLIICHFYLPVNDDSYEIIAITFPIG